MASEEQEGSDVASRVLAQSLPKPGVAEAMRFWHYTRPVSADHSRGVAERLTSTPN